MDREAQDDYDLVFRREGGGFAEIDRLLSGRPQRAAAEYKESLWADGRAGTA